VPDWLFWSGQYHQQFPASADIEYPLAARQSTDRLGIGAIAGMVVSIGK
jgi:hypothetical protein